MCGVVGTFGVENAAEITLDMMKALHYRGSQSSGCVLVGSDETLCEREPGDVSNLIHKLKKILLPQDIKMGLGHLRYGTAGKKDGMENAQPLYARKDPWEIYIAHNGDTPFHSVIRESLLEKGMIFSTTTDTECILKYIGMSNANDAITAILEGLSLYRGTYAITMLLNDGDGWKLIAARDHSENRPLFLGKLGSGWLIASEDIAFEAVEGETIGQINPGELIIISESGLHREIITDKYGIKAQPRRCVFENIYFSFPNSKSYGFLIRGFREELGRLLAKRLQPLIKESDVLTHVPDSSNSFMHGFSKELGHFPEEVITRKHNYRSFTEATQTKRESVIRKKFSFCGEMVIGKRVWIMDDSIVRGNTSRKIIRVIRKLGAKWIGMISSAPPIIGQCKKGIDFEEDLVATKHLTDHFNYHGYELSNIEEVRKEIEADCLIYTTQEDLDAALLACGADPNNFCYGCFSGKEPVFGAW